MILVLNGMHVYTAIAILAGQIFDLFDGRMAEKHGGTKVGPWLDDIADMVSFGLCPATMIFLKGSMSASAGLIATLYFFAIAFRLWRFLSVDKYDSSLPPGFFKGLPSPAGAMVALGACLFWQRLWVISIIIVMLSLLLISHVKFIHFGRIIIPNLPRIVVIMGGFIIAFILAYIIKFNSAELLGAFLLISFLIYIVINSKMISSYTKKK